MEDVSFFRRHHDHCRQPASHAGEWDLATVHCPSARRHFETIGKGTSSLSTERNKEDRLKDGGCLAIQHKFSDRSEPNFSRPVYCRGSRYIPNAGIEH